MIKKTVAPGLERGETMTEAKELLDQSEVTA